MIKLDVQKRIILLHGWGADTDKLQPLKHALKRYGWDVFIPKMPGFGAKTPETVWGLNDFSLYIKEETAKKWKRGYFVFGHSFGGRVAIKMALAPQPPAGLILCATGGISRGNVIKRNVFYIVAKAGKVFTISPPLARKFRKLLYKSAREHDYEKAEGVMRGIMKKIISEDLKNDIAKLKKPVLVLWGDRDKMTPVKDAYFIKNKAKRVKLVTYQNEGHKLPYTQPEKIAEEIELWYKSIN